MSIWHIVMLSAGAVAASTIGSQAGPCSAEIYSMEARVEATLKAKAADGPTLQVSREALLHRQPTPGSIAAAESRLGTHCHRSSMRLRRAWRAHAKQTAPAICMPAGEHYRTWNRY